MQSVSMALIFCQNQEVYTECRRKQIFFYQVLGFLRSCSDFENITRPSKCSSKKLSYSPGENDINSQVKQWRLLETHLGPTRTVFIMCCTYSHWLK